MKPILRAVFGLLLFVAGSASLLRAEVKKSDAGSFSLEQELTLPASPDAVYDALTGDISPWWDHSFSQKPDKLYIEPRPGGGFYEIFNSSGDGALHATVIYAERGKRLRFTGPLGLSGEPVDMVTTYELSPDAAGARLHLTVNATVPAVACPVSFPTSTRTRTLRAAKSG